MKIIVTGGAGYLGYCTSHILKKQGFQPILLDNFSTSSHLVDCPFPIHEVDLVNLEKTREVFSQLGAVGGIIHFAAFALVSESCKKPEIYFRNNVISALNVAQLAVEFGIRSIIHSSSCAVYGIPTQLPIAENTALSPVNPYGETKATVERLFQQFVVHSNLKVLNLRYFNPGGAFQINGKWIGENHEPETHLIPNVISAAIKRTPISIFGNDYPTQDGTCIRDFIHVIDLAEAHIKAFQLLQSEKNLLPSINLGAGKGTSVKEVIDTASSVLDRKIQIDYYPRRLGDPPSLVADISLAQKKLGWSPQYSLEDILHSDFQARSNVTN